MKFCGRGWGVKRKAVDTNVILRYLVEDPSEINPEFEGVYSFFSKIEKGLILVELLEIVLFQAYFVLISFYKVPRPEAAEKLQRLVRFKGLCMSKKDIVLACLEMLQTENLDIVDAYILAWSKKHGLDGVYSFDRALKKKGLKLLKVK
ncbi:MAG TPA: type II toxin-antitoxin system VapC family toxin [Proteobacteria bacterium]|nr:type II toxin-antitoxin system VapC family toxin [Pseudomonadota bacterium]